jgi:hypothetical protein
VVFGTADVSTGRESTEVALPLLFFSFPSLLLIGKKREKEKKPEFKSNGKRNKKKRSRGAEKKKRKKVINQLVYTPIHVHLSSRGESREKQTE